MKKLIATGLSLIMMLSSVSYVAFAEKITIPVNSLISNCNEDETVFYSEKQTLKFKGNLETNDYVDVSVTEPKMSRCWNPFKTKEFLRKTVKVNPEVNRFSIKGPEYKAPWWNVKDKIKYWWDPQNIYIDYALVLTSKDDEKILDAEEAKEGQLKPEIVNFKKFKEAVEKENGKDKISEFKEAYIERLLKALKNKKVDADAFNIAEHGLIDRLRDDDSDFVNEDWYYTKKEADEYNKKLREDKKKVVEKLAQKSGQDLITSGKIAELSKSKKEVTFRIVVNNYLNDKNSADVMSMLLSNRDDCGDFPKENLQLEFDLQKIHPLPKRLQEVDNTLEKRKLDKINEEIDKCRVKLTLKESVKKRLKNNDFIDLCGDIVNGINSGVKKIAKRISDDKKVDDQELPNDQSYESNESPEKAAEQEKQAGKNNNAGMLSQIKTKVSKMFTKKVDDRKLPNDKSSESNESPEKAAEQEKQAGKNNNAVEQDKNEDAIDQNADNRELLNDENFEEEEEEQEPEGSEEENNDVGVQAQAEA